MILPDPKDAIHKAWMYRTLTAVCDNGWLSDALAFKGGTCAAMRELLDRFSIDLDFDLVLPGNKENLKAVRQNMESIFKSLGLEIKDKSLKVPQYFLRYPVKDKKQKNTLKIDITMPPPAKNIYEAVRLKEIDRIINCQTKETMFANKLVALIERFEKNRSIAGRDLYDIHHFFISGYGYEQNVILERRSIAGNSSAKKTAGLKAFFSELHDFIRNKITQRSIDQDINVLLGPNKFQSARKTIKPETLMFINDEINRLK